MGRLIDLSGQKFGRLLVLGRSGTDKHGQAIWHCRCDCGGESHALGGNIRRKITTSCGCYGPTAPVTHGRWGTPEYWIWHTMVQRCTNPNAPRYMDYGGRGISVCAEWLNFAQFFHDMGERPEKQMTLGRIDNDGPYCKSNCRWETWDDQAYNKRPYGSGYYAVGR